MSGLLDAAAAPSTQLAVIAPLLLKEITQNAELWLLDRGDDFNAAAFSAEPSPAGGWRVLVNGLVLELPSLTPSRAVFLEAYDATLAGVVERSAEAAVAGDAPPDGLPAAAACPVESGSLAVRCGRRCCRGCGCWS